MTDISIQQINRSRGNTHTSIELLLYDRNALCVACIILHHLEPAYGRATRAPGSAIHTEVLVLRLIASLSDLAS